MDDRTTVETLLAAAGLTPAPDEIDELAAGYAAMRANVDLLYAPEFRSADPLLVPTVY
jgi:hypothetical protein